MLNSSADNYLTSHEYSSILRYDKYIISYVEKKKKNNVGVDTKYQKRELRAWSKKIRVQS